MRTEPRQSADAAENAPAASGSARRQWVSDADADLWFNGNAATLLIIIRDERIELLA